MFNQLSGSRVIVLLIKRPFYSSFKTETGLRERHISYKIQTFIRILLIIVKMYPSPPTIVPSMLHVLLQFHLITESNLSTFEVPTTLMPFQKSLRLHFDENEAKYF